MNSSATSYLKLSLLLLIVGFLFTTQTQQTLAYSGQGSGTLSEPYLIANCVQLQEMRDDLSASYALANNIDCSDTINWNGGKGFEPVGTSTAQFTGTLDGNNYTISDLSIIRADDLYDVNPGDEEYVGVIGYASNSTINDVNLANAKVKGWKYVGGIVGYANNTTISNVSVNAGLSADDCDPGYCVWARYGESGGGIVGHSNSSTITHAVVGASVKGSGIIIGGIAGSAFNSSISYATSTANVDGGTSIGGIVGSSVESTVSRVFASGLIDVRSDDGKIGNNGGGIIGYASYSTTTYAIAEGNVQGNSTLGGIVGLAENSSFAFSTSSGSVISGTGSYLGGFVGTSAYSTFATSSASGLTSGANYVGGFLGWSNCSSIFVNNSAHGLVQTSGQAAGGFVGFDGCGNDESLGSTFIRSFATGNIQGTSAQYAGGFIGISLSSTISESYATGNITGVGDNSGGFLGYAEAINAAPGVYPSVIEKSYATGSVTSNGSGVGGFAGFLSAGIKVKNSYARGDVEGGGNVAGFVGSMSQIARIETSYSSGHAGMTGNGAAGGFVALMPAGEDMFLNNYWDAETSGFSDDSNVSGLTVYATSTSAMKNQFTFINSNWNFASIWGLDDALNNGYPYLYYQSTGTNTDAPILTTVQAIPSRVYAADAHYDFTVSEACNIQATELSVSPVSEASVQISNTANPSGTKSASVTGMRAGSTYSFSFSCVDVNGNRSNSLTVGPFTVVADSESLTPTANSTATAGPTAGGGSQEWIPNFTRGIRSNFTFGAGISVAPKATTTAASTIRSTSTATSTIRATSTPKIFTRDLFLGSVGPDVKALQELLNSRGFIVAKTGPGSIGNETNRFGPATRAALIRFQRANNILPGTGAFGPRTRGLVSSSFVN